LTSNGVLLFANIAMAVSIQTKRLSTALVYHKQTQNISISACNTKHPEQFVPKIEDLELREYTFLRKWKQQIMKGSVVTHCRNLKSVQSLLSACEKPRNLKLNGNRICNAQEFEPLTKHFMELRYFMELRLYFPQL